MRSGSERAGPIGPDAQDVAERQRAARALMLTPLMAADGPRADDFRLVRRHQVELTRMFAEGLGYRLHVDAATARLFKAGLGRDPSRPLRRRNGAPFTPRAYAMTCLTLAALTRAKSQLLVDELVQQVRSAAVDAGIDVDLDGVSDRRALHAALVMLVGLGVLRERDGDLEHWVDKRTQSLLDIRREVLALLVTAPLHAARGVEDVLDRAALPSAIGGARTATRRRLLESPVLSAEDLTQEHLDWWSRNRNREREWYESRFGLQLELRAEGAALVDPGDEFSDEAFPGGDKTRHLGLLILEALAAEVAVASNAPDPWRPLAAATVDALAADVHRTWRDKLRRDQRDNPRGAIAQALDVLIRFGLVRREPGTVFVHAAATRYAPQVSVIEPRDGGQASLFDVADEDPER